MTAGSDPSGEPQTAPLHVAPPSALPTPGDACPTCSAQMAIDQRYCLDCGQRRGEPRLPFMDAVVFMNATKAPPQAPAAAAAPPPPPRKTGLSPSTTLVAGIATLVLAVGVGVLIGRSGDNPAPVAEQGPRIIQVGGTGGSSEGGGEEEAAAETDTGSKAAKKAKGDGKAAPKGNGGEKATAVEEGEEGGSKAAQEVLHTAPGVKEAKPEVKVGESCDKGTAGCSDSGEFNGSFFE